MLDYEVLHELSKTFICKLCPIIYDDGLRDAEANYEILFKELDAGLCGDFSEWFGLDPLGEVVYY